MPTYKCTECGREVELPKGTYSCEECGIAASMVEVCSTSTMRFPKFPPAT
ncbi:MAG: hypothetical protein GH150_04810 [Hadesarchaea archaeon]|nr:hypothetical protein [Hadesarchaea archaeon]